MGNEKSSYEWALARQKEVWDAMNRSGDVEYGYLSAILKALNSYIKAMEDIGAKK